MSEFVNKESPISGTEVDTICVGARVILFDIKLRAELNGKEAVVLDMPPLGKDRFTVRLQDSSEVYYLMRHHILTDEEVAKKVIEYEKKVQKAQDPYDGQSVIMAGDKVEFRDLVKRKDLNGKDGFIEKLPTKDSTRFLIKVAGTKEMILVQPRNFLTKSVTNNRH